MRSVFMPNMVMKDCSNVVAKTGLTDGMSLIRWHRSCGRIEDDERAADTGIKI